MLWCTGRYYGAQVIHSGILWVGVGRDKRDDTLRPMLVHVIIVLWGWGDGWGGLGRWGGWGDGGGLG